MAPERKIKIFNDLIEEFAKSKETSLAEWVDKRTDFDNCFYAEFLMYAYNI